MGVGASDWGPEGRHVHAASCSLLNMPLLKTSRYRCCCLADQPELAIHVVVEPVDVQDPETAAERLGTVGWA